jgi:hypothetical protein
MGAVAAGLYIGFEEGTTELEMHQILETYDLRTGYELDYDTDRSYYLTVEKGERWALKSDLWGMVNWVESTPDVAKGEFYIVTVDASVIDNEEFLAILDKYDLQLKQSIWCDVHFSDDIKYNSAEKFETELEENDSILFVAIEGVDG